MNKRTDLFRSTGQYMMTLASVQKELKEYKDALVATGEGEGK